MWQRSIDLSSTIFIIWWQNYYSYTYRVKDTFCFLFSKTLPTCSRRITQQIDTVELTAWLNCTSMYFPNLLELSLLRVLAFPNASNTELATLSFSFINSMAWSPCVAFAMNCKTLLDASVFPDPDSPSNNNLQLRS